MIAVISCDGLMLGLFTSQVDAWQLAKPIIYTAASFAQKGMSAKIMLQETLGLV